MTYDARELTAGDDFRREIVTGSASQLVAMTLQAGEEIGEEVHEHGDQLLFVVDGDAEAILDGRSEPVGAQQLVFVRAGVRHNIRNAGGSPLRLLSVYAPPEHEPGTVHATKAEADAAEHH